MPFTEEEKRAWRKEKQAREQRHPPVYTAAPVAICVHCHNPFGSNEGVVTEDAALCDICLGE